MPACLNYNSFRCAQLIMLSIMVTLYIGVGKGAEFRDANLTASALFMCAFTPKPMARMLSSNVPRETYIFAEFSVGM